MLYERVLRPAEVGVTTAVENEDGATNEATEKGSQGWKVGRMEKEVLLYGMFFGREDT